LKSIFWAAVLLFSLVAHSQSEPPQSGASTGEEAGPNSKGLVDGWPGRKPAPAKTVNAGPAPKHDISGTWDPGFRALQTVGALSMPDDGKPGHLLPYTPLGLETLNRTLPSNGTRSVLPAENNDPVFACDPQGMPREDLYELRTTQILQTPLKMVMMYQFAKVWRVIWTDGRELPKDPEQRWYGYSVGKWVDDTTLVVETSGTDERTWIDRAGRPHSADLHVEERFHRVDLGHMDLTVTIDDPKMYKKPWVAVDKLRFELQPPDYDVREMICSPSEFAEYNKLVGGPASEKGSK